MEFGSIFKLANKLLAFDHPLGLHSIVSLFAGQLVLRLHHTAVFWIHVVVSVRIGDWLRNFVVVATMRNVPGFAVDADVSINFDVLVEMLKDVVVDDFAGIKGAANFAVAFVPRLANTGVHPAAKWSEIFVERLVVAFDVRTKLHAFASTEQLAIFVTTAEDFGVAVFFVRTAGADTLAFGQQLIEIRTHVLPFLWRLLETCLVRLPVLFQRSAP